MKRTNIVVDEKLVDRAKRATGIRIMRQLVDHALSELVRRRRQRDLLKLRGKVDWGGDPDAMRRGRVWS